jgi:ribosomal protein S18 acetylase RimI-like enzyme
MSAGPCEALPWDTAWFGFRVARVRARRLDAARARAAVDWCAAHGIACLYFLGSDDPGTRHAALRAGFAPVDIRVTLERDLRLPLGRGSTRALVRPATPGDMPALRSLARRSHRDSRFFRDAGFPRERAAGLYERWLDRAYADPHGGVLTAPSSGPTAGYVALGRRARMTGRIELLGVAASRQRRGIGSALVLGALRWFRQRGFASVEVVTQAHNVAAQRLYQRHGFRTSSMAWWYHRWFAEALAAPRAAAWRAAAPARVGPAAAVLEAA